MRRILAIAGLAFALGVVAVLVARPTIVKAGHTAGLQGRTHLVVKEHNLKQLFGFGTGQGFFQVSLRERLRDGTLTGPSYVVPAGRVFIVTDVFFSLGSSISGATLRSGLSMPRFIFDFTDDDAGQNDLTREWHFNGGIAFDPGSEVNFEVSAPLANGTVLIDVIGYETVDV